MTRHVFEPMFFPGGIFCRECLEPQPDPVHIRVGETCKDCGNLLALHSDDHPCPNPPVLDPSD